MDGEKVSVSLSIKSSFELLDKLANEDDGELSARPKLKVIRLKETFKAFK